MNIKSYIASFCVACALLAAQSAQAIPVIAYEWTEGGAGNGTNSPHVSHHTSGGPVLADDFTAAVSGRVTQIDWWGSNAASSNWEVTFHNDGLAGTNAPALSILSQHLPVVSSGTDLDGDGVFFYSALWTEDFLGDVTLTAGTNYWFSTANAVSGWTWANAGGAAPTVGSEQYDANVSSGAPGSPHFGPWSSLQGQDFAYRIWVDAEVPEPSILALLCIGLAGFGLARNRKQFKN